MDPLARATVKNATQKFPGCPLDAPVCFSSSCITHLFQGSSGTSRVPSAASSTGHSHHAQIGVPPEIARPRASQGLALAVTCEVREGCT